LRTQRLHAGRDRRRDAFDTQGGDAASSAGRCAAPLTSLALPMAVHSAATAAGSSSPTSNSVWTLSGAGTTLTVISSSAARVPSDPAISFERS
jgi:hypothetical protein